MFTREDYMTGKCSHQEYYGQFVTEHLQNAVVHAIGIDHIKSSTDIHFNDIPLKRWDALPWFGASQEVAKANGTGVVSISDKVCLMKEAARRWKEA